ncbi:MAG: TrpB-like pyridoxal-phosphate dependent enzyme, partial [Clostridia bacterium]|nr:TrpB-like pyridoxal-phosphate dependent enzyme [Clostridia bacterium]
MKKEFNRRITLTEQEMPTAWYNIQADIDDLPQYLHPETLQPISEADLAPIFPPEIIKQELS